MSREPRVAFLARDLVWADQSGGSLAFSYAARKLEASVRSAPDLAHVETLVLDLRTDDVDAFFEALRAFRPTLVAASTYIWSVGLFCELARRLRAWDPSIRFVMGGPAARPSLLSLSPYAPYRDTIDAIVTGEGEEVVRQLVRASDEPRWRSEVAGLQYPSPLGWTRSPAADRPALDDYASPYQLGTAPRVPGGIGYLETFRGCPMGCAFCQWGVEKADRIYSSEYLASHLLGLKATGAERVYVLDAGFNLSTRAFRNLVRAEREVGVLRDLQVLGHIYPTYITDEYLTFFESFRRAEITIGVQSFDKEILKRLGRPFDLARFERVLGEMGKRFDLDLEIILGLPGDDPVSFRRTFERAIELATTVRVFYCLALPDALLERAEEFHIDFDPQTFRVRSCDGWTQKALAEEWAYVQQVAATMSRPNYGPNWVDFRPTRPGVDDGWQAPAQIASEAFGRLQRAVAGASTGWTLVMARVEGERLLLELDGVSGRLALEVVAARPDRACFIEHDGIAYSYRSGALGRELLPHVGRVIESLHAEVGVLLPVVIRQAV